MESSIGVSTGRENSIVPDQQIRVKDVNNSLIGVEHDDLERRFICQLCLKNFATKGNLNKHADKHMDPEKRQCESCLRFCVLGRECRYCKESVDK